MRILTVDIGTGTQDVFLYDSNTNIENGYKLILPSPTMLVRWQIQECTRNHQAIVLYGRMMGGGPNQWAAQAHIKQGLAVYATPEAAQSFNDDLAVIEKMGIKVLSEDEIRNLPADVRRIEMVDFDFEALKSTFERFGIKLDDLAAVGIAVFDHGDAPPEISDRKFRFDYLDKRIREENRLSAFAYPSDHIPQIMTRLQSVVDSAKDVEAPLVVMDSAPAAVLGALYDPKLAGQREMLVANIGNLHTLAFRLGEDGIEGLFEHHTGLMDQAKLDGLLEKLADGTLSYQDIFSDHGHGALVYRTQPMNLKKDGHSVVITGPRRSLMNGSSLNPYFASPFGDMMLSGCFGLLSAIGDILPDLAAPIQQSLMGNRGASVSPWEVY